MKELILLVGPLTLWEKMNPEGFIPYEFMQEVPEEILEEINTIKHKLELKYYTVMREIVKETVEVFQKAVGLDYSITDEDITINGGIQEYGHPVGHRKAMGLYLQKNGKNYKHTGAIFLYYLDKKNAVCKYIMRTIKPKANVL